MAEKVSGTLKVMDVELAKPFPERSLCRRCVVRLKLGLIDLGWWNVADAVKKI
jgi:hypothetical protein